LTEKIEWLDGTFDLLLVLLGIITSVLFGFQCTRIPLEVAALNPGFTQTELFNEVNRQITVWLRVFFIPLISLIGIWFVNRIGLRTKIGMRKSVSEFCYGWAFTILSQNFAYFFGVVTFTSIESIQFTANLLSAILNVFNFLIILGLVYTYETTAALDRTAEKGKVHPKIWKSVSIRTVAFWFLALVITNWTYMLARYGFIFMD
jgi:hypothetical protein